MDNNNLKISFKNRVQKLTPLFSLITGLVCDFLSPLGPILKTISIIGFTISFIILLIYIITKIPQIKGTIIPSFIFSFITGVFFFVNSFSENGILSDNIPGISNLQNSLSIIQEDINRIENKVDKIDDKVEDLSNTVIKGFDKIESLIEKSNPFENPETSDDFLINAFIFEKIGNSKKAIKSYESFFELTESNKFDLYLNYYNLLRSEFGKSVSKKRLEKSDLSVFVFNVETLKGYKLFDFISKSNVDDNLKNWTFIYKLYEMMGLSDFPSDHEYNTYNTTFNLFFDLYRYDKNLGEDYIEVEQFFYIPLNQIKLIPKDHITSISSMLQSLSEYLNQMEEKKFKEAFLRPLFNIEKADENFKYIKENFSNIFMNGEF